MKGIVFNLFEEIVSQQYGEDAWDDLLQNTGLDGSYTSLGNYPDEQLLKLVGAASVKLKTPADELVVWFGRHALPLLAKKYPQFFLPHKSTLDFILTLNDIIHPEVRKVYPGADVPDFKFESSSNGELLMAYRSARRLCALAQGLIEGAADYYKESVAIDHPECMKRGNEQCLLRISLKKPRT